MARILVVDDDAGIRGVLRRAFERQGHTVILAGDGLAGARAWREQGADVAFLDIHMPGMDGIELLAQLRAAAPALPIVAMSGGDQTRQLSLLRNALLLGARVALAKPFSLDEVNTALARVLDAGGAETGNSPA
ncbi:MAG: response regulator transcription factor [Gemmatimonadales bacterium]|jgi:CheY-like chemotaxis protein